MTVQFVSMPGCEILGKSITIPPSHLLKLSQAFNKNFRFMPVTVPLPFTFYLYLFSDLTSFSNMH
jgi:hypothetical protein